MTYSFRPAQRTDSKPLIGLYGQSGCGKTYSALLLARGLVGPKGKIAMIDTESGRGSLYADVIPGGYDTLDLGEPFSPDRYIGAMDAALKHGADIVIFDSGSHEWEGIGGVIDMAGEIEQRTGKPGLHCWKEPKLKHQRFMLKLLQAPIPVICCLRAKFKSRQGRNPKTGKTEIVKDEHTTPVQAEDFIYEMMVHAEILQDHTLRVTKCSHPDLVNVFEDGQKISIKTGEALAEWAKGGEKRPAPKADGHSLEDQASVKADEGTAALRAWFEALSPADKRKIKPTLPEYKEQAEAADAALAGDGLGFDDDETEAPHASDQGEPVTADPQYRAPDAEGEGLDSPGDPVPQLGLAQLRAIFINLRTLEEIEEHQDAYAASINALSKAERSQFDSIVATRRNKLKREQVA